MKPETVNPYLMSVGTAVLESRKKFSEIVIRPQVSLKEIMGIVPRGTIERFNIEFSSPVDGLFREGMDYKSMLSVPATDSDIFNDDRLYHSSFKDALDILKNNADYSLKLVDDFDMESAISENYRNEILECCEIAIKYKGYIEREKRIADKIMRLENLISDIQDAVYAKITENRTMDEAEARDTARIVGLAALKYGDLSNQASKDYVFDVERFASFEGNTGPYILYTIVRIKSILAKYIQEGGSVSGLKLIPAAGVSEKNLSLSLVRFFDVMEAAYMEKAPHKICQYIYDVSNAFNGFYHDTKILSEQNREQKESYIALISLTKEILLDCIDLLGIECPERM